MAKKNKIIITERGPNLEIDGSLERLIRELQIYKNKGYVSIGYDCDYESHYSYFPVMGREETDEEYDKRISGERAHAAKIKAAELAELERLKRKYEA